MRRSFPSQVGRCSQALRLACLFFFLFLFSTLSHAAPPLLITEFMSSNKTTLSDEDGDHPDWIEIHNPSPLSLPLEGWTLTLRTTRDERWTFPTLSIPSQGYLVVFASGKNRSNPSRPLHTDFKLPASGGSLFLTPPGTPLETTPVPIPPSQPALSDVSYGLAPLSENIPLFPTNQPSQFLIPNSSAQESDWTRLGINTASWRPCLPSIGFELIPFIPPSLRHLWKTDLGNEPSLPRQTIYLRIPFTASRRSNIDRLILQIHYLDGFTAFLNGEELVSRNDPPELHWNSEAPERRTPAEAFNPERIELGGESLRYLRNGENVLAIQGFLHPTFHSQFILAPQLIASVQTSFTEVYRYQTIPSPGAPNNLGTTDLGPALQGITTPPPSIQTNDPIVIQVRAAPTFAPIRYLQLHYRTHFNAESIIPMFDDGIHDDGALGDGIYGARIPAGVTSPQQMIRWRVTALDSRGIESQWPDFSTPTQSPQYVGTVVAPESVSSPLPVLHWFIQDPFAASSALGTRASLYFQGRLYDNIAVHIRGNYSRGYPKVSYKFDFNPGHLFQWHPDAEPAEEINLNTTWSDKSFMRPILSWEVYGLAQTIHPLCIPVRIQQNQQFHSVAHFVEEPDQRFLRRHHLATDGILFKMFNGLEQASGNQLVSTTPRNPFTNTTITTTTPTPNPYANPEELLQEFVQALRSPSFIRDRYLYDHVDIPQVVNYLAASVLIHDNDIAAKNYFLYRDPAAADEWMVLPWDKDLTFGRNFINGLNDTLWATNDYIVGFPAILASPSHPFFGDRLHQKVDARWNWLTDAILSNPDTRDMFLMRLRSLMDQILQPPSTPFHERLLEGRITSWLKILQPDATLDNARWQTYPPFQSIQTATSLMIQDYLQPRRKHLFQTHSETNFTYPGRAFIPDPSPQPRIRFGTVEFAPTTGNPQEGFIEIQNMEGVAVDISGWTLNGVVSHVFTPGSVLPGFGSVFVTPDARTFRNRSQSPRGGEGRWIQGGLQGPLSRAGGLFQLQRGQEIIATHSVPSRPTLAQQYLRITRIAYDPAPLDPEHPDTAQQLEYIELTYTGPEVLQLAGLQFTRGIQFHFSTSSIPSLFPSADPASQQRRIYIVRNPTLFRTRFGVVPQIAGTYSGQLDNDGEWIKLEDLHGEVIHEFRYDPTWQPLTQGLGFALQHSPSGPAQDWLNPQTWSLSLYESTGLLTSQTNPPIPQVLISEILYNPSPVQGLKAIELYSPTTADISGWFLSDDPDFPRKFRFPEGTLLQAGQYFQVPESTFRFSQPGFPGFGLNSAGDSVFLFAADPIGRLLGYIHGTSFGGIPNGSSLAYYTPSNQSPYWTIASSISFGRSNPPPQIPPIAISEIHFHPPHFLPDRTASEDSLQYVELHNNTSFPQPLYLSALPTNRWRIRGGISFAFPPGTTLAPNETVLIVPFTPTSQPARSRLFSEQYQIHPGLRWFGPWTGRLSESAEHLQLVQPILAPNGLISDSIVDEVAYDSAPPWPITTSGLGASLSRLSRFGPGLDRTSWTATAPTPGRIHRTAPLPSILVPPVHTTNSIQGSTEFRTLAIGDPPLQYQWLKDQKPLRGATLPILPLAQTLTEDEGSYSVLVMNDTGVIHTPPVQLVIRPAPWVASQPQGFSARLGANTNLTITTFGTGTLQYRWYRNGLPYQTFTSTNNISSTTHKLNFPALSPADAGIYFAEITDAYGVTYTMPAEIQVLTPPSIIQHPASQIVRVGESFTLTVQASGSSPLGYRWRNGPFNLPQYTSPTLTIANAQPQDSGDYFVIVTNSANPRPGIASEPARILVLTDTDHDLMPDSWEQFHGLNPSNPADASEDPDRDQFSNVEEFFAGTDPRNRNDFPTLRLQQISTHSPHLLQLSFPMVSNRTYQIQTRSSLHDSTPWQDWLTFPGRITNSIPEIFDPLFTLPPARYYRLHIPTPLE